MKFFSCFGCGGYFKLEMDEKPKYTPCCGDTSMVEIIGKAVITGKDENTGEYIVSINEELYRLNENEFEDPLNIQLHDEGILYHHIRKYKSSFFIFQKLT
jgi:ribosomal protein L13